MEERKIFGDISIKGVIDSLSNISEIDLKKLGAAKKHEVTDWLDETKTENNKKNLKEILKTAYNYLFYLYTKRRSDLDDPNTQTSIQSLMMLIDEAGQKLSVNTNILGSGGIEGLEEYRRLHKFYSTKIISIFRAKKPTEGEEELEALEPEVSLKVEEINDLDVVRRDDRYELFYIRKENNQPFYTKRLLRHIKLVGNFDELLVDFIGEDPFVQIKTFQDRDRHYAAKEIVRIIMPYLKDFYHEAVKFSEIPLIKSINKCIMALFLCSNPRNLIQNTVGKSCVSYFDDFLFYLRETLKLPEYQAFVAAQSPENKEIAEYLLKITHLLCSLFFLHTGARREIVEFIEKFIEKSKESQSPIQEFIEKDESLRGSLSKFPNGPIFKALDVLHDLEAQGFDPYMQQNTPEQIFTFSSNIFHISFMRQPCPTSQTHINSASIVKEFEGFLRNLKSKTPEQKQLIINLQDRTSWQEYSRCIALEKIQESAEFSNNILVVTLPKNTDFFHQRDVYEQLDDAESFKQQILEQVGGFEQCGFYFPKKLNHETILNTFKEIVSFVHEEIFLGKKNLAKDERLEFLEILYTIFIVKLVIEVSPSIASLVCKDAVDTSAVANAEVFALLKLLMSDNEWERGERKFFLWLVNAAALFNRDRAANPSIVARGMGSLNTLYETFAKKGQKFFLKLKQICGIDTKERVSVEESHHY